MPHPSPTPHPGALFSWIIRANEELAPALHLQHFTCDTPPPHSLRAPSSSTSCGPAPERRSTTGGLAWVCCLTYSSTFSGYHTRQQCK
ncbi:hypothetical protein J6590_040467 [Homalodisca vitripennis]|nr:hypothetical protein J6590_040467 [Homalodisca vitripennis]